MKHAGAMTHAVLSSWRRLSVHTNRQAAQRTPDCKAIAYAVRDRVPLPAPVLIAHEVKPLAIKPVVAETKPPKTNAKRHQVAADPILDGWIAHCHDSRPY